MSAKTIQLRRYTVKPGQLGEFVAFNAHQVTPVRELFGFAVEFAYPISETNEFVWALSFAGDRDAFLAAEATYNASPERAAVFDGPPKQILDAKVVFVDSV